MTRLNANVTPLSNFYPFFLVTWNPEELTIWDLVIMKIRKRLSNWKQKTLSFGGRLCLVKSVLTTLPLYYLFFFKVPIGFLKERKKNY